MRVGAGRSRLGLLGKGLSGLAIVLFLTGTALVIVHEQRAAASSVQPPPVSQGTMLGKSGLPLPRFVSLKAGRVNVRVGPGEDYKVSWVFTKATHPVEVIAEFDTWRRVRDSDGEVGWVFHSLLSSKRTAVVTPWSPGEPRPIHASAAADAPVTAYLEPGVTATVDRCRSGWCALSGAGFSGWISQDQLWGVYPDEEVD
jgi:SH3-like domain-containing protein